MTAPLNKSARKISSLFALGNQRDNADPVSLQSSTSSYIRGSPQVLPVAGPDPNVPSPQSGSNPNLYGHRPRTSINSHGSMAPPLNTVPLSPLAPPPTLVNFGTPRPASSHGSGRSRQSSRGAAGKAAEVAHRLQPQRVRLGPEIRRMSGYKALRKRQGY